MTSFDVFARAQSKGRRGFILLAVAWLVLILTLIIVHHLRTAQIQLDILRQQRERAAVQRAADGFFQIFLAEYTAEKAAGGTVDALSNKWGLWAIREQYGKELEEAFPDIDFSMVVEDEGGKIRVSRANLQRLTEALQHAGVPSLQASQVAQGMIAHVHGGEGGGTEPATGYDLRSLASTEEEEGSWLARPAPSTPFDATDPLSRIPRLLSSFPGVEEKPNINLAPREILLTIPSMSSRIADDILLMRYGPDRVPGNADDIVFTSAEDLHAIPSMSQFSEFGHSRIASAVAFSSTLLSVRIEAISRKTQVWCRIDAVLQPEGNQVSILSFTERSGVADDGLDHGSGAS